LAERHSSDQSPELELVSPSLQEGSMSGTMSAQLVNWKRH
jgi:hypothetical protein